MDCQAKLYFLDSSANRKKNLSEKLKIFCLEIIIKLSRRPLGFTSRRRVLRLHYIVASSALLQRCKINEKTTINSTFTEDKIQIHQQSSLQYNICNDTSGTMVLGSFPNMLYRIWLLEMFSTLFGLDSRDPIHAI